MFVNNVIGVTLSIANEVLSQMTVQKIREFSLGNAKEFKRLHILL